MLSSEMTGEASHNHSTNCIREKGNGGRGRHPPPKKGWWWLGRADWILKKQREEKQCMDMLEARMVYKDKKCKEVQ